MTTCVKIVDWISYKDADAREESFGGMGGWFGSSGKDFTAEHTWADYLARWDASVHPHAEALREAIVEGRIWESGEWHQADYDGARGVPLFDDGTVASFSFRAWGDLLAAVWTEQLKRQFCYMDFYYCGTPVKPPDFEARASMGVKR